MAKAAIFDTEVNGLEHKEVVQVAYSMAHDEEGGLCFDAAIHEWMFKPSTDWEPGAVAVHGILPDDVSGCQPSSQALHFLPEVDYLVGHNVDFDCEAVGNDSAMRICTLALSRDLWPSLRQHTLGAVFYEVFGLNPEARDWVEGSHNARDDVQMTVRLLKEIVRILGATSLDELWRFSEAARIPKVMPFGKHKGKPVEDVPADYVRWYLRQDDVDPYLAKALTK